MALTPTIQCGRRYRPKHYPKPNKNPSYFPNSSGMCCGVVQNAYHTLESIRFVLPDGLVVDSARPDADELLGFGFDEMLDPPDVAAIEWSSRFPQALPKDRLAVRIERVDDDVAEARRLDAEAAGPRATAALAGWQRAAGAAHTPD